MTLKQLQRILKKRGITQVQIAARLGITKATVNKVLHGRGVSAPVLAMAHQMIAETEPLKPFVFRRPAGEDPTPF